MASDRFLRRGLAAAVGMAAGVLCPFVSQAARLLVTPSVTLEEAWDSNVFNVAAHESEDFVFRARPLLTLALDAFQTSTSLTGGFELERYAEHSELDASSATKYLELKPSQPLRFSPRFSLLPAARYVETRDTTRRNLLTESPIPGLPPSEVLVTVRTNVRDLSASVGAMYQLSPAVDLEAGAGIARRDFTEDVPGLVDSRAVTGNLAVRRRFSERFSSGVFASGARNTFSDRPGSRTYAAGLSAIYRLTERLTAEGRAGATLEREPNALTGTTDERWYPTGMASLAYAAEAFRAALSGGYDIAGAGSLGLTTRRGWVSLSFSRQFTQRWSGLLSGTYQTNRSTDDAVSEDLASVSGTAGIRYQPAAWITLSLSGSMFRQWSHGVEGTNLERNSAVFGVTLANAFPLL